MSVYFLSYDSDNVELLKNENINTTIECNTYLSVQCTDYSWLVQSNKPVKQLSEEISKALPEDSYLFITEAKNNFAGKMYGPLWPRVKHIFEFDSNIEK